MAKSKKAAPSKLLTKKVVAKKAPSKAKAILSRKRDSTSAQQPIRIIVEVVIKNDTSFASSKSKNFQSAFSLQEVQQPNFEFKFSMANGVRLTSIYIDGLEFDGQKLEEAAETDSDGKIIISIFANVQTTPVSMIIDAVGEPNRVATFTLKFNKKDVYKDDNPQKIKIDNTRRGQLSIAEVNLP